MNRPAPVFGLLIFLVACNPNKKEENMSNHLIHETSPYLLQHARNPVDWYPWGEAALAKAKKEDKPILVSIGYSSCHWCHVMEHESFENDSIAKLMNDHFISIKVDREERPDVDQIYMEAVQAMGQNGGWPLNVFLTPDQKPFYGGTYFPPKAWYQLLKNIAHAYENDRERIETTAGQVTHYLSQSEMEKYGLGSNTTFQWATADSVAKIFSDRFDTTWGGRQGAPKFPMPVNWQFLLHYGYQQSDQNILDHVELTLDRMAAGGIYDQVGGGFARYSVDAEWHVPHFEKMLYDNGQLMQLYAAAFQYYRKSRYKEVAIETAAFLEREMMSADGGFFSALDADSEGEEGKFYVWEAATLKELIPKNRHWVLDYFDVKEAGNWEENKNVLRIVKPISEIAAEKGMEEPEAQKQVQLVKDLLLKKRANRVRPGRDDKILTGWNGLTLGGLCEVYSISGNEHWKSLATETARFLEKNLYENGQLLHQYTNGKADIPGYLEDYALLIDGLIHLYQITFDEHWLDWAYALTETSLQHFSDENEPLLFFTDDRQEKLIARKKEVFDNVIPASNSVMAHNFYQLGIYFDKDEWKEKSKQMLNAVVPVIASDPVYAAHWCNLYVMHLYPTAEIAIVGDDADTFSNQLRNSFIPNALLMGTASSSDLPLLKTRYAIDNRTTIFVCFNKTCKLPVHEVKAALEQLNENR